MSINVNICDLKTNLGNEDKIAFVSEQGMPLDVQLCGITYPYKEYSIARNKVENLFVFESIISGAGYVWADGKWQKASKGDSYILTENNPQYYFADHANPWQKVWINVKCTYMGAFLKAFGITDGVYHIDFNDSLLRLYKLALSNVKYSQLCFHAAETLNEIVMKIAALQKPNFSPAYNIAEILKTCVYSKVTLDDIAAKAHLSKSQLIRIFKAEYKMTPYDYLLKLKIETAKILIKNSSLHFKEIAEKLYILDEHYFSTLFLKHTGLRPKEYRESNSAL